MSESRRSPASVYRLFGAGDKLLYIGVTTRGMDRLVEHASDDRNAVRWRDIVRIDLEHFDSYDTARAREQALIAEHCPPANLKAPRQASEVPTGLIRRRYRTSAPEMRGVHWDRRDNSWNVGFTIQGRHVHVGAFRSLEAAKRAARDWAAAHFVENDPLAQPRLDGVDSQ